MHYRHTCGEKMGDRRKQDLGKVDQHRHACGKKWQIRGGKTSGRWAHHPTQAHMWETMGHKRRQGETRPREGERSRHKGKQRVTRRDKTLGRRTHLTMGDKRRQDPGKADTASNAGTHAGRLGDKGRQDLGKADASANAREDKTSGRRTHQPTQAHMWGDNGRQWETIGDNWRQAETRPREGRRAIQDRHTCVETMGDKRRQDRGKAGTASNGHTCGVTMGDKNRQTMRDNGRQGETRAREGGRTINKGTHVGRQWEMIFRAGGHTIQLDIVSKQREPNQYTVWGRKSIFYLNCIFFFGHDGPFFPSNISR